MKRVSKTIIKLLLAATVISGLFTAGCTGGVNNSSTATPAPKVVEKPKMSAQELAKEISFYANNEVVSTDGKIKGLLFEASPMISSTTENNPTIIIQEIEPGKHSSYTYSSPEKPALKYVMRKCRQSLRNEILQLAKTNQKYADFGDIFANRGYVFAIAGSPAKINAFNSTFFADSDFAKISVTNSQLGYGPCYLARFSGYINDVTIYEAVYITDNVGNIIAKNCVTRWTMHRIPPFDYNMIDAAEVKRYYNKYAGSSSSSTNHSQVQGTSNSGNYGYIAGTDVNVRSGANTQATVIDCLDKDTRVEIIEYIQTQGQYNWYRVRLSDGRIGYVAHPYIRK